MLMHVAEYSVTSNRSDQNMRSWSFPSYLAFYWLEDLPILLNRFSLQNDLFSNEIFLRSKGIILPVNCFLYTRVRPNLIRMLFHTILIGLIQHSCENSWGQKFEYCKGERTYVCIVQESSLQWIKRRSLNSNSGHNYY